MARVAKNITILAEKDDDGKVHFHMKENGVLLTRNANGLECIVFDKKKERMDKNDHHEVHFKLDPRSNAEVVFCGSRTNVMWAKYVDSIDGDCPDEAEWLEDVFYAERVYGEQKHLTVINTNMEPKFVAFRLNFVPEGEFDVPPDEYIAYDPIGNNQNGGFPMIVPDD